MTIDRRSVLGAIAGATIAPNARAARMPGRKSDLTLAALEVEWRTDPVGIDTRVPRFGWRIAPVPGRRGIRQTGWHVIVATSPIDVRAGRGTLWDSGIRRSAAQQVRPERPLSIGTHRDYWWCVRIADETGGWSDWSAPARFVTGILDPADWGASWIAGAIDRALPPHAVGQATAAMVPAAPLPIFRRELTLAGKPARAYLSIAGLGQYTASINGATVGDAALAPGWTQYRRSILYDSYDVTGLLRAGANAIAIRLGNGMFNVEHLAGRYTKFLDSFGMPKAILRLTIEDDAGGRTVMVSDARWRTTDGSIRFSSIYGGEDIDARDEPAGWDHAGFDDRDWRVVQTVAGPGGRLRASGIPPVRVIETLPPVAVSDIASDITLVDFGKNLAGRPSIAFAAATGATVTLIPGEELDAAGRVSQQSFNADPTHATLFRFTAAGQGIERFTPRFSYHGFRYVEIHGIARAAIEHIAAEVLHADCARIGSFEAGAPLLGRIHGLIDQAVSSNMMSVLTDCPQREKLGWLEQTYLNAPTVLYNRDAITLYEKLVADIADAQRDDGMVPGIAPEYVAFVDAQGRDQIWRNSPEWGAAAILAPWAAYRFYGDATILRAAFSVAERYIAYLESRADRGIVDFGMGDWYDIGPADPGPAQLTSRALTGTAIFQQSLATVARIAERIGEGARARRYRHRADEIAVAFNARFLDAASGRYERGSQTALAMPLALGIVPPRLRAAVTEALIATIRRAGNGVTAGDIGFRYVLEALSDAGRDDVVYDMLSVTDRPSYGYQLAQGATALTEAWDANPTKSLNHFMLGHAEDWFYRRLAGLSIDYAATGTPVLTVAPRMLPAVGHARGSYRTRAGEVASSWRVAGDRLALTVTTPQNLDATVRLPATVLPTLEESGRAISRCPGLKTILVSEEGITLGVDSGSYVFDAVLMNRAPNQSR